ncbi:MAG: superoxide dismutase [Cu-Zn] SodC [Candidatus Polarisedimenticolia bacterium]
MRMKVSPMWLVTCVVAAAVAPAMAAGDVVVEVKQVSADGVGKSIGTVTLSDSPHGLLLTPKLEGLTPGLHGFHVHQNPSCEPADKEGKKTAALAAGDHMDPQKQARHEGPYGEGHLGDLPPLFADASGKVTLPVLAPKLKVTDVKGHALMVHAGGDNYADTPEKLGGGGARIACGVVP